MSTLSTTTARIGAAAAAVGLVVILVGCGSGASKSTLSNTTHAPVSKAARTAAVAPRLVILAPARGAHTGQALTVRVAVSATTASGRTAFRYLLDGRISRLGSSRLTFHELTPGRHRLVVMLAGDEHVRATSLFIVRAPMPVTAPEPVHAEPAAVPAREAAPAPAPSQTSKQPPGPAPATTPSPAPAAEGAIPQNNGGDGDSDNNGGPSDGDGNL